MKELVIITVSPSTKRFAWENYIYLHNLREKGLIDKARVLVFIPLKDGKLSEPDPLWKRLEGDFPEARFFYYNDNKNVARLIEVFEYIPLLRPYCLSLHFKEFPELRDKAIFYTDSDILLTKHFDFTPFLDDHTCYLSEANSYTNADFFESKYRLITDINNPLFGEPEFVVPGKYDGFKRRNILAEMGRICGITEEKIREHNHKSGAAQYLLKNIDHIFWNNVFDACIEIRGHLRGLNQEYMRGDRPIDRENNGWQSWCADIWAVQFNLYKRNYPIETPPEFDFAWATDDIERLERVGIYHNAGVTDEETFKRPSRSGGGMVEAPAFYKGKTEYTKGLITPFEDVAYLNKILTHPESQTYTTHYYVQAILKTKEAYNL